MPNIGQSHYQEVPSDRFLEMAKSNRRILYKLSMDLQASSPLAHYCQLPLLARTFLTLPTIIIKCWMKVVI